MLKVNDIGHRIVYYGILYSGINYWMLLWSVLPAGILISHSKNDFINFPSVSTSPLKNKTRSAALLPDVVYRHAQEIFKSLSILHYIIFNVKIYSIKFTRRKRKKKLSHKTLLPTKTSTKGLERNSTNLKRKIIEKYSTKS